MSRELLVVGLDRMPYEDALTLQRGVAEARVAGRLASDVLLLAEHPPVVTLGRSFQPEHLPTTVDALQRQGIGVFEIERGGDITFHGPGQLVGYPIYDLREHRQDLHWYLRQLEAALIGALGHFGIEGGRNEGYTGVWTSGRKIASIGIHVKQWVTWHGFALNVTTDLSFFDLIVPCGIPGVVMTSLQRELGERTPRDVWERTIDQVVLGFAETFGQVPQAAQIEDLTLGPSQQRHTP
ncbi:MAG: lipoyl(octanoyl) transferase LipB [Gemmatimonadales bacterium]|nr:lipoyl(octanoyl) transferase LipB [Gemmatimonadales bacterium]